MTERHFDTNAFFIGLRRLMVECEPNTSMEDRLIVLLIASIERGIPTRCRLMGVAKKLGFNSVQAAKVLDKGLHQYWHLHGDQYSVIDPSVPTLPKPLPDLSSTVMSCAAKTKSASKRC